MERIIKKLGELLPDGAIVFVDIGENMINTAKYLKLRENGRIFISGGLAAMGCSLPEAVGASIAANKNRTFCICGDGGFQMNIQELATVVAEELPIVIFLLNNNALGLIRQFQNNNMGGNLSQTASGFGYENPDFFHIAEAYGLKAVEINNESQLESGVRNLLAFEGASLCVINVEGFNE